MGRRGPPWEEQREPTEARGADAAGAADFSREIPARAVDFPYPASLLGILVPLDIPEPWVLLNVSPCGQEY